MTDTYILLEKYLAGTLAGDELLEFEAQLRSDKALQAALSLQRQGRAAMKAPTNNHEADFQKILAANSARFFGAESSLPNQSSKIFRLTAIKKWAAAAAVLVLVFAGTKWYVSTHYAVPDILAQYYAPAATPATLSNETYHLQEAYAAYRNRQYAAAIKAFGAVPSGDPQYAEAMLFTGYAYYESGQYTAAVAAFEQVVKTRDVRFASNAEWHKLLAALADNPKVEDIEAYFQPLLSNAAHPYHAEAKKLKRQLKNPLRRWAG